MIEPVIKVENLVVQYEDRLILDHLNFSIAAGEVLVILGGSGSGKTTLLNHLIGLKNPNSGKIFIHDKDIVQAEGIERESMLRNIGVMFQSGALFGSMTLLENVLLPLREWTDLPEDAMNIIALNKLKLVGLENFSEFLPAEISGGMQKRAAIARAMALDPRILFLDEPSAGLDPITSANLDGLITELSKTLKITFVVVTHELASVDAIADRVIMLNKGKIVAEGKPEDLRQGHHDPFVEQFFNRKVEE